MRDDRSSNDVVEAVDRLREFLEGDSTTIKELIPANGYTAWYIDPDSDEMFQSPIIAWGVIRGTPHALVLDGGCLVEVEDQWSSPQLIDVFKDPEQPTPPMAAEQRKRYAEWRAQKDAEAKEAREKRAKDEAAQKAFKEKWKPRHAEEPPSV